MIDWTWPHGATGAALARSIRGWQRQLEAHWSAIRFGNIEVRQDELQIGVQAQLYLGDLDPKAVQVELYADPHRDASEAERHPVRCQDRLAGSVNGYLYLAVIPAQRPASDYTIRVIPAHVHAQVPLEASLILWQH